MKRAPVKSLLISNVYFPPQTGGISSTMGALVSALGPAEVCCLTAARSSSPLREGLLNAKVYRRPSAFATGRLAQAVGFTAAMAEIMLRERPQVVQLATAYEGYMGLWLERWLKLPFLVYAHGNEIFDALKSPWPKPRLSLAKAARVLANSRFTAQLVEKAGARPSKVEIIYAPCDVARFRPVSPDSELRANLLGSSEQPPVILSVGSLRERKGHDMVLRALPRLLKRFANIRYLIVGEGSYRTDLETLVSELGVGRNVVFLGKVPDERLPYIYALSDVFVMPSRERPESGDVEGFGVAYLEANACAKPVVAGRSGGVPDAVIDGVTGFLVDPLSPEEIATAIERILSSPEIQTKLGNQGKERVQREFTWPRFVSRIQRICQAVVEENTASTVLSDTPCL